MAKKEKPVEKTDSREVARALERWKSALAYYEGVSDPELISFAIYDIEAARRRYVFLLKRAGAS